MRALPCRQRGALMIEVLVTIVICVVGLWALMNVQARLQLSEMESYQRSQALMLLEEVINRVQMNGSQAASYVSDDYGVSACSNLSTTTQVDRDKKVICESLRGAAEQQDSSGVGAMIGARACIDKPDPSAEVYRVTVTWQGMAVLTESANASANIPCGAASYAEGTRRLVASTLRIADLTP